MTSADIPLGMQLKEQAGWNQMEADWQRFLALEPEGCFVGELDSVPAGTLTTCIFGAVAWVAMVLVDTAFRGRGMGKALLSHALDFLDRRGIESVRLDATPLGQPLYERLGFAPEYRLNRYEGILPAGSAGSQASPAHAEHWEGLMQLDQTATGTDRSKFLRRLFADHPQGVRTVGQGNQPQGYLAVRYGSRALQIGPCIANHRAGPLLLADAFHRHAGQRVYLDVPVDSRVSSQLAETQGLAVQRPFTRMVRGPRIPEMAAWIWASSGPEMG